MITRIKWVYEGLHTQLCVAQHYKYSMTVIVLYFISQKFDHLNQTLDIEKCVKYTELSSWACALTSQSKFYTPLERRVITLYDWIYAGFHFPVPLPINSLPVGLGRECPDRHSRLPPPPPPLQLIFCKIQYSWGQKVCCSWQELELALCKHNLKVRWRGRCKQKKATVCKSTEWEFHCIWFLKGLEITCIVMKLKLNSLIPTITHKLSFMLYLFPFI